MPYREVNELRKNGQLDEALEMAKNDLENDKSFWSYRALFWVLHDMCRQCLAKEQKDKATELVEKMKEILPNMEEVQGGIAEKQLDYLERQLSPLNGIIKQADQDSRDTHTVAKAFNDVKDLVCDDEIGLDDFQQKTAGWILYRYAKHELERKATYNVRLALSLYLKLKIEKPSLLHSFILRIAVDLETEFKNDFKFTAFLEMWGFDNFSKEDWERFETEDDRLVPCLAEKAIGRYCKELIDDHINTVPNGFVQLIESARKRFQNDGKIELNYARVLAARGETEQAINAYKTVTQKIPQAYVWQEMANLISDREIKQAILCKVITMQRDEQFLGDTRLLLAQQLIEDGNYTAAKFELDTYYRAKQEKGWSVKPPFHELAGKIPIGTQATPSNKDLYNSRLDTLNGFMYPDAKTAIMAYNGKTFANKRGKQRAKLVASDGMSITIAPNRLPRRQQRRPYYFYTVKYVKTERGIEPLTVAPIDEEEGLKHFQFINDIVRIRTKLDGKRYGFVGDSYVHQNLLGKATNGQRLKVLAIKEQDGRLNAVIVL